MAKRLGKFTSILKEIDYNEIKAAIGTENHSKVVGSQILKIVNRLTEENLTAEEFNKVLPIDRELREWVKAAQVEVSLLTSLPTIYWGDWLTPKQTLELKKELDTMTLKLASINKRREALYTEVRKSSDILAAEELAVYNNVSCWFLIGRVTIDVVPMNLKRDLLTMKTDTNEQKTIYKDKVKSIVKAYQEELVKKVINNKLPDEYNPFI